MSPLPVHHPEAGGGAERGLSEHQCLLQVVSAGAGLSWESPWPSRPGTCPEIVRGLADHVLFNWASFLGFERGNPGPLDLVWDY